VGFQSLRGLCRPVVQPHAEVQRDRAIQGWVIAI